VHPVKIIAVASAGLLLIIPSAAYASAIPATLSIRAGPLYLVPTAGGLVVVDATGSGDGWHVLASVTGGSASVGPVEAATCGIGSTCSLPGSDIAYPETITSSPVTIAEALPGMGMGTIVTGLSWQVTGSMTLQIVSGP
jgi:hypothetical protein